MAQAPLSAQLFEFDNRWETSSYAPSTLRLAQFKAMHLQGYRQLTQVELNSSQDTVFRHTYHLDSLGRLKELISIWAALPTTMVRYRYNAEGELASINGLGFMDYDILFSYRGDGKLERVEFRNENLPRASWSRTWMYRKDGSIKQIVASTKDYAQVYRFKYRKGQLERVRGEIAGKLVELYEQDSVLLKTNGEKLVIPKPPPPIEWRYSYNDQGKIEILTQAHPRSKDFIHRELMTYDALGKLTALIELDPEGQANFSGKCHDGNKFHFLDYNAEGLLERFRTEVCTSEGIVPSNSQHFYYLR